MKILENPTVRTTLIVAVATIGAVAIFVGPEDSRGILAETAASSASDEDTMTPERTLKPETAMRPEVAVAEEADTTEIVEWEDEAFIDDTQGFDPTPGDDDGGFNPNPVNNDSDFESRSEIDNGSAGRLPRLGPDSDDPMPGELVPIG